MATAQHTPGPWAIAGHYIGTLGVNVATVGYASGAEHANARLIAAAPDLLAALQYAAQFLADEVEQRGLAGSDMTDYQDEAAQALDRVEAAIAKATGQPAP